MWRRGNSAGPKALVGEFITIEKVPNARRKERALHGPTDPAFPNQCSCGSCVQHNESG
jgi:hypothetical protein